MPRADRPNRNPIGQQAPSGLPPAPAPASPRAAVVVSAYNATITDRLLAGALEAFARAGGHRRDVDIHWAPGAFELVALAAAAARSGRYDAVVALGCILKGQTRHDEFLGHAVTTGLAGISAATGVAVGLGVLTVNTPAQARARAGGAMGNKGAEAMDAALATARALRRLSGADREEPSEAPGDAAPGPARPDKLAARRRAGPARALSRSRG